MRGLTESQMNRPSEVFLDEKENLLAEKNGVKINYAGALGYDSDTHKVHYTGEGYKFEISGPGVNQVVDRKPLYDALIANEINHKRA